MNTRHTVEQEIAAVDDWAHALLESILPGKGKAISITTLCDIVASGFRTGLLVGAGSPELCRRLAAMIHYPSDGLAVIDQICAETAVAMKEQGWWEAE